MGVPHVVVIGAGFAGLNVAKALHRNSREAPVRVTVVDQHNHHTFQPLLYQVATASLNPQDVGHSIRSLFRRRRLVRFRLGHVVGVDWPARELVFDDGTRLGFEHLVVAAGAVTNDYGIEGVEEHGFPLKSIGEAVRLRNHVLERFEHAVRDPASAERTLRFVISGAGPTGVELAGALGELIELLRDEFGTELLDLAEVVLVEMADSVLPSFESGSRRYALSTLRRRGVRVELGTAISRVEPGRVVLDDGRELETDTLVWAAGVMASPLSRALDVELTRGGRVVVAPDLSIPGRDGGWAIGDIAAGLADPDAEWRDGPRDPDADPPELLPQLAPVAIQQGRHVADQIRRSIAGSPTKAFRYVDKGQMATIGRNSAVAELPIGLRVRGIPAWLAWLGLHLYYLIGQRNRLSVLVSWAWNYLTYDRGARLILHPAQDPTLEAGSHAPRAPHVPRAVADPPAEMNG